MTGSVVAQPGTHPLNPDVDADLLSESCIGIGVQYPHLWDVVKRYILRGDLFFQAGGLATLATNVHSLPRDEVADVLEEYYKKHDYWPPMGQTGRISLGGLRAIQAVGAIPTWLGGEGPIKIQLRMLALLDRIKAKAEHIVPIDVPIVDETRKAMQSDKPWSGEDWLTRSEKAAGRKEPEEGLLTEGLPVGNGLTREEVGAMIESAIAERIKDSTVTQSDITIAKHGFEVAGERIAALSQRITDFQMTITTALGVKQTKASESQVKWAKIASCRRYWCSCGCCRAMGSEADGVASVRRVEAERTGCPPP